MTVEEAIGTSIEFETRVRDVYAEAARRAEHPDGQRFFRMMADEEQGHIEYLESRLRRWTEDGTIGTERLDTVLPPRTAIEKEAEKLRGSVGNGRGRIEIEFLRNALKVEQQTSDYYAKMVEELPDAAKALFTRFLEIEDGHLALVQAQIDLATGTGYWFDVREFNLEG